jgi:L-cysteine:1D-myo-inositol 2-amino-2-deoxy-alpha-D-glucopyranoside ligase
VRLRAAGAAYEVDDDLYFPVSAAAGFGSVSGLDVEQMTALFAERGGDPDRPGKKDPLDALLWRAERPGEPAWDSPLGRGRPGWHVECAAIALRHLSADGYPGAEGDSSAPGRSGPVMDVQGGGSDLLFPHHEHSAIEAEAVTGQPFARAYVHAGMIGLDGEKMSKSRGNLVFVRRLRAAGVDPGAVRLALLSGHYRADREWTDAVLGRAVQRLAAWTGATARATAPDAGPLVRALREALADDLDTPAALEAVDRWSREDGDDATAPALAASAVDALLGVRLTRAA